MKLLDDSDKVELERLKTISFPVSHDLNKLAEIVQKVSLKLEKILGDEKK